MAINGKQILRKLDKNQKDKGKVTLYLSKGLVNDFRWHCGNHSVSSVMEELMREFIATSSKPKLRR